MSMKLISINRESVMRWWMVLAIALCMTACSKTVQWEEEVPLNTGDTIWVKRTVTYSLKGAGGNPLDMAYRPDWTEKLAFEWKGKEYIYKGDADLMLLAISPLTKQPVLIAQAANKQWGWSNNYYCTTPYYVQFVPDETGKNWTWPASIETWLYSLPKNIMVGYRNDKVDQIKDRYTARDRAEKDATADIQDPSSARVDSTYTFKHCFRSK